MQRQGSFAEAEYAGKKKQTRRDKFLAEMEQAVPWPRGRFKPVSSPSAISSQSDLMREPCGYADRGSPLAQNSGDKCS
jgi:hypothetical protein